MRGLVNGKKKRLTIRLTESAYRRLQALMSTTTMSASRIIDDAILQQPDPTLLINALAAFDAKMSLDVPQWVDATASDIGIAIVQREMKREMESKVGAFKIEPLCATCEGKGEIEVYVSSHGDPHAQVFRCPDCRGVGRK